MKLCRYGNAGREAPGLIDRDGRIRDLSGVVRDLGGEQMSPAWLQVLANLDPATLPLAPGTPRLGAPLAGVGKFIAIGLNYVDHANEAGMPIPTEPVVFMKPTSCIVGGNDDVMQPKHSTKLDWEVELGIVIGSTAQHVDEADALAHVAGYCVINDVSERAFQLQSSQWDKGKGCDTFGPMGPWIATRDEIPDPQNLDMWLDVNGVAMQRGNTRTMIFGVAPIVAYLSRYMTLYAGDVICTGTPPGVGMGKKPAPIFLKPGDVMTLGIAGLGEQRQKVVPWARTAGRS
jgi:2-keto-4-pentenoate hydratase/2-oxohepta-3-ene-1,7-dioic acid hydratase in catechol pathway